MRNNQSPSIYSVFQNALPYYLDRIDLYSMAEEGEAFSVRWLHLLLNGSVTIQVNMSSLAADKMRHLYFEARNLEKTTGAKTLGFGYPLFIDSFENELIISPVFIWLLSVEPAQAKQDAWIVKFSEEQNILPNYRLVKHLKEKYDLDWTQRAEELSFGRQLNHQTLHSFCDELAQRLHFQSERVENKVAPSPGIDELGSFSRQGAILWAGIFSVFPPQHTRWNPGQFKPEVVLAPEHTGLEDDAFVFPHLPPNPREFSVQETVARNKITILEGNVPASRGQTIINILFNALSEGKKCLVVSEKSPALKYTQSLLSKAGLNQLNFLLDDALNDKMPMLELLRVALDGLGRGIPYSEEDFQFKKNKYLREKAKIDAAYQAVNEKVFGENTWTETVGLFLASNRVEGKELLSSQLNSQEFQYSVPEYDTLKQGILNCYPLFQRIKTLSHPLSNLSEKIILDYSAEEGLQFVNKQIQVCLNKASQLQHRYITKTDAYAARLKEHYEDHYQQLSGKTEKLLETIEGYGDSLGDEFRMAGARSFKLPSLFSKKKKKIQKAQEEVVKKYKALLNSYSERQYFDFNFSPSKDGANIPKAKINLESFLEAQHQWRQRIDGLVQEEVMRLNSKTVHPDLDSKEQVKELEYALDVLLEELNEANLYERKFENKTLTIPQREKYLESVIEQLETTQLNLRDYELFYQWQSQWLKLDGLGKKVVRALVKVKPDDWMAAFESWYFNNLLNQKQQSALPNTEALMEEHSQTCYELNPLLLNQILNLWQNRQSDAVKTLKKKNRKTFQLIFEKQGHRQMMKKPLGEVLEPGFDTVTAFLPVLFVTPHIALNIIPSAKSYFDYVIFEEANFFSVEAASGIAPLGKKVVISGSNATYGNETSLLQYALENGVPSIKLDSDIPEQMNSSSGDSSTISTTGEIQVENVEGRFDELEGTNDVEAQHIIRLLNQIKQTPQRVFPSVGIVAFTIEQRNLISNYLLKLKQQNALGSEKIKQLERNGMGVFQMDELFGQHFDVLIFSCTYGMVNLKGMLTKKIVFLNTPEGISRIKLLINQPTQKVYFVHSFPHEALEKFALKKHEQGTWLLAQYAGLAEAIKNEDGEGIKNALKALGKFSVKKPMKSVFAQEVSNALHPYIDEKRFVKNLQVSGVTIPLSTKPIHESEPPVAIHPDGFFSEEPFTFSVWEVAQRKKITQPGLVYQPVWSVNWLKNPAHEARLLASKIIKLDGEYKEGIKEKKPAGKSMKND